MAITESLPTSAEVGVNPYYNLSFDETTALMQAKVSPGLEAIPTLEFDTLCQLTDQLKQTRGVEAVMEYERYNAVKDRRLELPEDQLYAQLHQKTVLVSGGTGLIGSALMTTISQFGPRRLVSISRGETPIVQPVDGAEYYQGDIRDKASIQQLIADIKPDIIYHVAADKYNHEAEKRAHHTLTTNIFGVENILEAAEAAGTSQVVYASTGKATRPYSPDIYASSKKTGEFLMSRAAARGNMLCSAARFTHVVDDSNVRRRINEQIDAGQPVRLQSPDVMMYVQSAYESAQLLLISGLEARPKEFKIQAIRNLDRPINLIDLGLGAIVKRDARVPIYFQGVMEGYEDRAWPHLYGLENAETSPLVNSIEAHTAHPATSCPEVDSFEFDVSENPSFEDQLTVLRLACENHEESAKLRQINQHLAWAMLDARIDRLPIAVIERISKRIQRAQGYERLSSEFTFTNDAFLRGLTFRRLAPNKQ